MDEATRTGLKRTAEMCALFMVGNGVMGLAQPERRLRLWTSPRPWIDAFVRADRRRSPALRRTIALAQIAAGLALASRLKR